MANVMSAIGGGVEPPCPRDFGFGSPAGWPGAGGFPDEPKDGSAVFVFHAGDGTGVSDPQERRKRCV